MGHSEAERDAYCKGISEPKMSKVRYSNPNAVSGDSGGGFFVPAYTIMLLNRHIARCHRLQSDGRYAEN
ncbi:hypothetical protein CBW46_005040 [Paenibacillus xerothermodurans]|uniref:Uncharacterized protein n=1 Tax=Paenibacillus xerothermodurans TaxID=1977292 RepID=A0A2W1NAR8_PAEXE|nr:hypothetical protein CBW46_005040 [Paenibacillus xerothermodurans]